MFSLTAHSWNLADAILRGEPLVLPTTGMRIGLHTAIPDPDCANAEVAAADYQRLQIPTTSWNSSVQGVCTINSPVVFPEAAEFWGGIVGVSFWDEEDNAWLRGALKASQAVTAGVTFRFDTGMLKAGLQ